MGVFGANISLNNIPPCCINPVIFKSPVIVPPVKGKYELKLDAKDDAADVV